MHDIELTKNILQAIVAIENDVNNIDNLGGASPDDLALKLRIDKTTITSKLKELTAEGHIGFDEEIGLAFIADSGRHLLKEIKYNNKNIGSQNITFNAPVYNSNIIQGDNASAKAGKNGSMQKTITFIDYKFKRDFDTDNLVGRFKFTVIDSSLTGTPREHSTTHTLKLIITEELMDSWRLAGDSNAIVTDDMTRVALQIVEDHISEQIKKNALPSKMPLLFLNTENSPTSCPYKISNIPYPRRTAFTVEIDDKVMQPLVGCLADFANHIKAEMRMTFWQFDKTKNKYKWVSQPEQRGKDLLRSHLNGRFGDSFYTLEEISAGAGIIDLYIITPTGEKAIVELKMCGHGYTKKWALGGIEQLFHYMDNKRTTTGYLIVFDSRVRDFSIGFPPTESVNGMIVTTIVIDLRPYVKRADAPDNV